MGHLSFTRLSTLGNSIGFRISNMNKDMPCSVCPLSKQKRLLFVSQNVLCSVPFQLIHIDVWGPFTPISIEYKYFLTIVDDHTRYTWIYLLKSKSDVLTVFPSFCKMIYTQFHHKIQSVRSDNAPELNFSDFFQSEGILSHHSCVNRPQQNSVVERKHQHILNVARALMFQSNIPISYWSDCVLTSIYLINRTPSPLLSNSTPFELLFNKAPSYVHLKVFGCLCYGSTLVNHRTKFSPRATKSVFLGYPSGYKAYKLLNLLTNEVYISRDVVFHESIFPFMDQSSSTTTQDVFTDSVLPQQYSIVPASISDTSHSTCSHRLSHKPALLQDYHCYATSSSPKSSTAHPLFLVIAIFLKLTQFLFIMRLLLLNLNHSLNLLSSQSGAKPWLLNLRL